MHTIYVVEDDQSIREAVVYALRSTGFSALGFADGSDFFAEFERRQPHLVLLDIMLPGEGGIQILQRLRACPKWQHIPVIMLTAKGSEYDKILGLETGADDYVTKPFRVMELISRIKAVLRRHQTAPNSERMTVGGVVLDLREHCVTADGGEIELTLKQFELLGFLMKHEGRVFTRDQLLEEIWGIDFEGESRTVDVHIGTIRQKLGRAGSMIKTIRGVGYRLVGDGE